MKKDYSVNVRTVSSENDWDTSDMSDWYETYNQAMCEAEKAFDDSDAIEVVVTTWVDGEVDGTPLRMIREDGNVFQYLGETRLWA